ncbi:helix-turn-helix domain-containing protein [Legionella sp. CNM-1927-20]|uniref:helix-turn-helix domain-containing protein n=1 Tax=Legionella sp. CNM-1927-20 TaxID=3422221 RepID=UPI00403AEEE3
MMITSDRQYEAAREQLKRLQQSLMTPIKKGVPASIAEASKKQTQELMDEIQRDIDEYRKLIEGKSAAIEIHSLEDLLFAPIRYRLATNMTIESFGQKVGVSPRQIARYEKEAYQNINTSTLKRILGNLNININGKILKDDSKAHVRNIG